MTTLTATETEANIPFFGHLAFVHCGKTLPLQVLETRRGYYLGTTDNGLPCSRESGYYRTHQEAANALESGRWTQRLEP